MAERRRWFGKAQVRGAALAAAAVLCAGIYVTLDAQGNGADAGACAAARPAAAALDPLVGGEIAAFQIAGMPDSLADLAFTGADGKPTTLAAFKGKVALVNLWATWCAPCRKEMPALDRLQAALGGDGFRGRAGFHRHRRPAAAGGVPEKRRRDEPAALHRPLDGDLSGLEAARPGARPAGLGARRPQRLPARPHERAGGMGQRGGERLIEAAIAGSKAAPTS